MSARAHFQEIFLPVQDMKFWTNPPLPRLKTEYWLQKKQMQTLLFCAVRMMLMSKWHHVVLDQLKNQAIIVIAGYPVDSIEALRKAGIEHFIHMQEQPS